MKNTEKGVPCPQCGWIFGPHVCVDLSKPCVGENTVIDKQGRARRIMSDETKAKLREAQIRRFNRTRSSELSI